MIRRYAQWLMILVALLILVAVFLYNSSQMPSPNSSGKQAQPSESVPTPKAALTPIVSVITVRSSSYHATIKAYASAKPQYELALKSQLSGSVSTLSKQFETGQRLTKNDELLTIDDSDYQLSLASAKAEVADAKLQVLKSARESEQAKSERLRVGKSIANSTSLALHVPQMKAANATLSKAEASLANARHNLDNTRVIAPFDAVVSERLVTPGSYVQKGTHIATLYSSTQFEVELPLTSGDWLQLPPESTLEKGHWPVTLSSVDNGHQWKGKILRLSFQLDAATRQRTLTIAVNNPLDQMPALLPGTFLEAIIKGRKVDQLWELPTSALSQRSEIWFVQNDNVLASFKAEPIFYDEDKIYISPPEALAIQPQRVLVSPLNGYLQGMNVTPVKRSAREGTHND